MKLLLVQLYPWRPHIEHMMLLAKILKKDGHDVHFLKCDGSIKNCYQLELKNNKNRGTVCAQCKLSGVESYVNKNIHTLINHNNSNSSSRSLDSCMKNISSSSAYTLLRVERNSDKEKVEVKDLIHSLSEGSEKVYQSISDLISNQGIEGLIIFNARMDMLAAAAKSAEDHGVPYLSIERSIANYGIMMKYNENCLGLKSMGRMIEEYKVKPLTKLQCDYVLNHISSRFIGSNKNEYMVFNKNRIHSDWPINNGKIKVLITPSSICEFMGDPQNDINIDYFDLIETYLKKFNIGYDCCVVREHPNCATKFSDGAENLSAQRMWREWCFKNGIHIIKASSPTSTYSLIEQCDILLCNGSSTAMEAGILGKHIVCFSPSRYEHSGFLHTVTKVADMENISHIDPTLVSKRCMRYIYTSQIRFPQYSRSILPVDNKSFTYNENIDSTPIINMLKTGHVEPSDANFSCSEKHEDNALCKLKTKSWQAIFKSNNYHSPVIGSAARIRRRVFWRWIDWVSRIKKTSKSNH